MSEWKYFHSNLSLHSIWGVSLHPVPPIIYGTLSNSLTAMIYTHITSYCKGMASSGLTGISGHLLSLLLDHNPM